MAKKCQINRDNHRRKLIDKYAEKRLDLRKKLKDPEVSIEEKLQAQEQFAKLPRNSSAVRVRNRCLLTGRPRGNYRKLKMSRIALRELASTGQIPGMVKSSW